MWCVNMAAIFFFFLQIWVYPNLFRASDIVFLFKSNDEPEHYRELLEEVTSNSTP